MDPNPMERLVEYIMSLSTNIELPVEIVKLFLKLRFFNVKYWPCKTFYKKYETEGTVYSKINIIDSIIHLN